MNPKPTKIPMTWEQQEELAIHGARMILDRIISDWARIEYRIRDKILTVYAFDAKGKFITTQAKSEWDEYIAVAKRELDIKWK